MTDSIFWAAPAVAAPLVLATLFGLLLGIMFYGGLWWTVRRAMASPRPATWFLGSGLLRTGLALPGVWWIGQGHWERLALCLAGLVLARTLVAALTARGTDRPRGLSLTFR